MHQSAKLLSSLTDGMNLIANARHHEPFSVLGVHRGKTASYLLYRPGAYKVELKVGEETESLSRVGESDFFYWQGESARLPEHPQFKEQSRSNGEIIYTDPYSFESVIPEDELSAFNQSEAWEAYRLLGAHTQVIDTVAGTLFSLWAPNAERVSVVGDFNRWDGRTNPMRCRGSTGVWELFLPGVSAGDLYKFEIRNRETGAIQLKADPYGQAFEFRPDTASRVKADKAFEWNDQWWLKQRTKKDWLSEPLSIYEVHLGSWMRTENDGYLDYKTLAYKLVEYVKQHGFTHIQLLPITEHPFDGSWGYQVTGYFAPTSRFGEPEDFKFFVNWCHQNDIGVILDWVPGHFPRDSHGLANFDGTPLYEHEDPRLGEHKDWGTLIFNYGRREVINFLLSSAHFWLQEYHLDGLRVDAVASMIYLDYSREAGEWAPNRFGGNENLEAIAFLQRLNTILHQLHPGVMVIAEESTAWPQVSRPVYLGGLGFTMKWNMGWMNDTFAYFEQDPIHRKYHHDKLTFSLLYAFSENFVLPFSHDEVVHGKRSILEKMPGDTWQKFANVRLLYTYLFTHPGKKLMFMGDEFAQGREWDHDQSLDWYLTEYPLQRGVQTLVKDLNKLYQIDKPLHQHDFDSKGFEWVDCHDNAQSVISFLRKSDNEFTLVVLNFTPVPRHDYRIGVPEKGVYSEVFNSDSLYYEGSNVSNGTEITSEPVRMMNYNQSVLLSLPPLSGIILKLKQN